MADPQYYVQAHYRAAELRAQAEADLSSGEAEPSGGKPVDVRPAPRPYVWTLINRQRQLAKSFRREHGRDGRPMSGRQFRRARKRGNRLARLQPPTPTLAEGQLLDAAA